MGKVGLHHPVANDGGTQLPLAYTRAFLFSYLCLFVRIGYDYPTATFRQIFLRGAGFPTAHPGLCASSGGVTQNSPGRRTTHEARSYSPYRQKSFSSSNSCSGSSSATGATPIFSSPLTRKWMS